MSFKPNIKTGKLNFETPFQGFLLVLVRYRTLRNFFDFCTVTMYSEESEPTRTTVLVQSKVQLCIVRYQRGYHVVGWNFGNLRAAVWRCDNAATLNPMLNRGNSESVDQPGSDLYGVHYRFIR